MRFHFVCAFQSYKKTCYDDATISSMAQEVSCAGSADTLRLETYLARIGIASAETADLNTLTRIMAAHSRAIAFENIDVVLGKRISMAAEDVEAKLLDGGRGGYCFEQNTLLRLALTALGYRVRPLLCRVRWGKRADQLSTFSHLALAVALAEKSTGNVVEHLVDVGFAGTNSIAPVLLGSADPQTLPEGQFRVVPESHVGGGDYTALQMLKREEWKSLYTFRTHETAVEPDLVMSNWLSCTFPSSRFTNQFFTSLVVGDERHHILNDSYVIRTLNGGDDPSTTVTTKITDTAQLVEILSSVFGLEFSAEEKGLGRYLA